ncbi:hypothetical protein [Streptomyces hydrogenans]
MTPSGRRVHPALDAVFAAAAWTRFAAAGLLAVLTAVTALATF